MHMSGIKWKRKLRWIPNNAALHDAKMAFKTLCVCNICHKFRHVQHFWLSEFGWRHKAHCWYQNILSHNCTVIITKCFHCWPETLCPTIYVTQRLAMRSLEQHWRHTFCPSIRTCSTLEESCVTALYKYTITYLLTYLAPGRKPEAEINEVATVMLPELFPAQQHFTETLLFLNKQTI